VNACDKAFWSRRSGMSALLAAAAIAGVAAAAPAGSAGTLARTASLAVKPAPAPVRLPKAAGTPSPIKHVVVIYLENHSFDNILGYWCNQNRGRCPDGGMPASVRLSYGSTVTPGVTPDKVPQMSHSVATQRAAMNGRRMNGWDAIHGCNAAHNYACISGYRPSAIPNITGLASRFAISDDTFSQADSPSWGGHLYAVAGTLDGFAGDIPKKGKRPVGPGWGCDSNRIAQWGPAGKWEPSCIPQPGVGGPHAKTGGAFRATPVPHVPTIMDRLDAAGRSWHIYGATHRAKASASRGYGWSICPSFAGCLYTSQDKNLVSSADFQHDALNGNLPAFSVVAPGGLSFTDSCHNSMSITACDNWAGSLVSAVENGPDWDRTAVFITWDDCGCFYDQVPPPAGLNADGTAAGPRVPLIIVSPYAKRGYTDTTATTFAGILAYTEHTFSLAPVAPNDAAAYDFRHAFDYSQTPLKPVPMTSRRLPYWARHLHLTRAMLDDPT
jgi:phospholipase C